MNHDPHVHTRSCRFATGRCGKFGLFAMRGSCIPPFGLIATCGERLQFWCCLAAAPPNNTKKDLRGWRSRPRTPTGGDSHGGRCFALAIYISTNPCRIPCHFSQRAIIPHGTLMQTEGVHPWPTSGATHLRCRLMPPRPIRSRWIRPKALSNSNSTPSPPR